MIWKTKEECDNLLKQKESGNDAPLNEYIEEAFQHFRKVGFPHFEYTIEEKVNALEHIIQMDTGHLWKDTLLTINNSGYGIANSYHPHFQAVRSHTSDTKICNSPMDSFNDDRLLRIAIFKTIKLGGFLTPENLRNCLKFAGDKAVKRVSNFRPTAAKAIYDKFLPLGGGVVFDPSCGFGGRLIGAMCCKKVVKYIGTDPSTKTFEGLQQFVKEFDYGNRTQLICDGSENADKYIEPASVDLVFTSPPYFSCEMYADEETQSWKKYPDKDSWLNVFMKKTISNCMQMLKKDGYIIINIADVPTYKNLADDFENLCKNVLDLSLIKKLYLELPSLARINSGGENCSNKTEPIFVFQKKGDNNWALTQKTMKKFW